MPTIEAKPDAPQKKTKLNGPRFDNAIMEPGQYEVTRSSTFTVKLHLKLNQDKWWTLVPEDRAETTEEVVFRMWTYDEMVELRKLSTKYDTIRRVHMIDHDLLNQLKIQRYMLSWTFDKTNPRLELHHINGVLSDETWEKVKRLQTNLLKYIVDEMNERYEFGL